MPRRWCARMARFRDGSSVNLYVISTAVLPTSSQANPTFTAVQLGLRMAAKLGNSALH